MRYVLFDLETEMADGPLDLDRHVPAITVGATLTHEGDLKLWHERTAQGQPTGDTLSAATAVELVEYLARQAKAGHSIVTWNGAGFDFRVLAHASGMVRQCTELAWEHLDMMFWLHCRKGFSVALSKAAEAVGSGKTSGMTGADAPRLWAQGDYARVLKYVAQDVRAAAAVYEAAVRHGALRWINTRGRVSQAVGTILPVRRALRLPQPDTSWMRRKPWLRTKFVGWMQGQQPDR